MNIKIFNRKHIRNVIAIRTLCFEPLAASVGPTSLQNIRIYREVLRPTCDIGYFVVYQ